MGIRSMGRAFPSTWGRSERRRKKVPSAIDAAKGELFPHDDAVPGLTLFRGDAPAGGGGAGKGRQTVGAAILTYVRP